MRPALSSPTNLTIFIVLIVLWALVIVPRFVRLIYLLVRSSYPFGRNPWKRPFRGGVGRLVQFLPPSGYATRAVRVLLVISLILFAVTWLFLPLSLLFPAFEIALRVGWVVTFISVVLTAGALLASEEPDKDNKRP